MKKIIFRYSFHEMLRTRCFNLYIWFFGAYFSLGIHRKYQSSLKGKLLGVSIVPQFPFYPFRGSLFIPSLYVIEDVLSYLISINGGYSFIKKMQYAKSRINYFKRN